jgi:hypothetical protein
VDIPPVELVAGPDPPAPDPTPVEVEEVLAPVEPVAPPVPVAAMVGDPVALDLVPPGVGVPVSVPHSTSAPIRIAMPENAMTLLMKNLSEP